MQDSISHKILFLFFAIFSLFLANAQYHSADSITFQKKLEKIIEEQEKQDYTKAMSDAKDALYFSVQKQYLFGEAWALIKINDISIEQGDYTQNNSTSKIIQTGNQLGNKAIEGIGHMQAAQFKMYNNKPAEAEPNFETALKLIPPEDEYAALCWNDRGYNASLLGDLQKQTECYLNALRIYEKINNQSGASMVYSNLSVLYYELGQTSTAIQYAKKAISIRESLMDIRGLSFSYCNISQLYLNTDLKEAAKYSALCTKVAEQLNDDGRKIQAINTAGLVKEAQGEKGETLKSALEVMKILERSSNPSISLSRQYLSVGIIMSETRMDSTTALSYIDKSLDMAFRLQDITTIRDAYNIKTVFFKIRNDFFNAYENLKKFHRYKDSIITSNTQTNIAELQTKYETEKKDNEITRLNSEQEIKQLQIDKLNTDQRIKQLAIEKQNAIIAGNKLLTKQKEDEIVLLSKERELLDLEIKQQSEALVKQQLLAKTQQQQLDLAAKEKELSDLNYKRQKQSKQIIIGSGLALMALGGILFNRFQLKKKLKEQENLLAVRDVIAKDLHDEVGSTLSSIKILSEVSHKNIEKDSKKSAILLEKIVEQSDKMQQGMSDIVWAVKPDNDKLEDIITRMREYISRVLEPKDITVHFGSNENILQQAIGMQQRRDLLMIFKEAINNIAKHAKATTVTIKFDLVDSCFNLLIQDDGIGFNPDKARSSSGLKNMKARTEKMGGELSISSLQQKGSTIKLKLPVV